MFRVWAVIVITFTIAVFTAHAQTTFGSIVGVVHDPSDQLVSGAPVKLQSLEDNSVRTTTTDADGAYPARRKTPP